uniref:ANIS5_cation-bd domain-containing protein n=1 Tax=Panagrellus redivivus TaxID=6233 RepID=A0A7E4WA39_PANRE
MKLQLTIAISVVIVGIAFAQGGGVGGTGIQLPTLPAPTFLQGLSVSEISEFLSIINNANMTQAEITAAVTEWANQFSNNVQNEVGQWLANVTAQVEQLFDDLDSVVSQLSPEAQALFNNIKQYITNIEITTNAQCANVISLVGGATNNVLSELFTAVPILGNICGIQLFGGILGGLVGGLVAALLGLVGGILGGLLGGLGGVVGGVVGSIGGGLGL